jgi:CHAD domain-containing protein
MDLTLEESIREIIHGRISSIREQISNREEEDLHVLVHEIRKSMKRIRAVLKLIRDEIGFSDYHRENLFYRDLGRRLSGARDSHVLGEVLSSLREKYPGAFKKNEYERLTRYLEQKTDMEITRFSRQHGGFGQLEKELARASIRTEDYCRLRNDFISLKNGIKRIYQRGRRHLSGLQKQYDMAEFHEYRKNNKYLLHQMEILTPIYPRVLKSYVKSIDRHAELLGESRDLDRLELFLQNEAGSLTRKALRSSMLETIGDERGMLLEKAFSESFLIYAESPGALVKRLESYWKAHDQSHT